MFYFQGSVEGGRVSVECRRMSDCLRGKKTPPPEYNDGVDRADDRRKEEKEEKVDQSKYNFSACTCLHSHVLNL